MLLSMAYRRTLPNGSSMGYHREATPTPTGLPQISGDELSTLFDILVEDHQQTHLPIYPASSLVPQAAVTATFPGKAPSYHELYTMQVQAPSPVTAKEMALMTPNMHYVIQPHSMAAPIPPPRRKTRRNSKPCSFENCKRMARSKGLCKAHAENTKCSFGDCTRQSQGRNLCVKHGGGRRCEVEGCSRAAQSKRRCKAHGGGPRCTFPGCTKSSQGSGKCRTHGGGPRCRVPGCNKGVQRLGRCASHSALASELGQHQPNKESVEEQGVVFEQEQEPEYEEEDQSPPASDTSELAWEGSDFDL